MVLAYPCPVPRIVLTPFPSVVASPYLLFTLTGRRLRFPRFRLPHVGLLPHAEQGQQRAFVDATPRFLATTAPHTPPGSFRSVYRARAHLMNIAFPYTPPRIYRGCPFVCGYFTHRTPTLPPHTHYPTFPAMVAILPAQLRPPKHPPCIPLLCLPNSCSPISRTARRIPSAVHTIYLGLPYLWFVTFPVFTFYLIH